MKAKSQIEMGRKYPKNAQATHQNGTCVGDEVGGMARDGHEEYIKAKESHQMCWNQLASTNKLKDEHSGYVSLE